MAIQLASGGDEAFDTEAITELNGMEKKNIFGPLNLKVPL